MSKVFVALREKNRRKIVDIQISNAKFVRKNVYDDRFKDTEKKRVTGEVGSKDESSSRRVLQDYTECSSVHGVQYLGNISIGIGVVGKIIWILTMIAGFACLGLMVIKFWERYQTNPTTTLVESFYTPTFFAPFPAVTICPLFTPSIKPQVLDSLRPPPNATMKDIYFYLLYANDIIQPNIIDRAKYLAKLITILKINNLSLIEFLRMTKDCKLVFNSCWWNGKKRNCNHFFRMSYSSKGLCCSFNYALEDYIEMGSDAEEPQLIYADQFGPLSGLTISFNKTFVDKSKTLEKIATNSIGIMVFIHHPMDFPGSGKPGRILQAGQELHLVVQPTLSKKPEGFFRTNHLGHMVQECIPENTGILTYFPKYNRANCFANCKIKAAIQLCGCVPFNYYSAVRNYSIRICDLEDFHCLDENSKELNIAKQVRKDNFTCYCPLPCTYFRYTKIYVTAKLKAASFGPPSVYEKVTDDEAVLRVFQQSQVFTTTETIPAADEIYLLASIGGIFSLFLGCSFLSVIELIYFSILLYRTSGTKSKHK